MNALTPLNELDASATRERGASAERAQKQPKLASFVPSKSQETLGLPSLVDVVDLLIISAFPLAAPAERVLCHRASAEQFTPLRSFGEL